MSNESSTMAISSMDMASCRISTIGVKLDHALALVERIRVFTSQSDASTALPTSSTHKVPWTISNKYYSADVHFSTHSIHTLAPYQVQNVPAVLFVWLKGQDYRPHIERLASDLDGYDPEVMLAVRIHDHLEQAISPDQQPDNDPSDTQEEEVADIDEFLSSHGFEFVDAIGDHENSSTVTQEENLEQNHAIPRLPRVIDALSTIMWPNMKPSSRGGSKRGLIDPSRDDSIASLQSLVTQPSLDADRQTRRQREVSALRKWLEEEEKDYKLSRPNQDPWTFTQDDAPIHSPIDVQSPSSPTQPGFDDDFSAFVSAPPLPVASSNTSHTAELEAPQNEANLHVSFSTHYHSLGSTSDLGDPDLPSHPRHPHPDSPLQRQDGEYSGDESSDDGLPTQEEIQATSSRLFGVPSMIDRTTSATTPPPAPQPLVAKLSPETPPPPSGDPLALDTEFDFGHSDYQMAPFDLSHVMSALQQMKAEISSMEDEGERRKAAASVALSLVYGLEGQPP